MAATGKQGRAGRTATGIAQAMALLAVLLCPPLAAQTYPNPLNNTATVTVPADVADPAPGNNSAIDTNALALQAQLSVSKALLSANPVAAGGQVQYRIQVNNAGPSVAMGVGVVDTVSSLLTGVAWTCQPTTAASSCAQASGTGNAVNVLVNVGVGDSVVLQVTGTAPTTTPATVPANSVSLVLPPGTTDPTPGDNSASAPAVPVRPNTLLAANDSFPTPVPSSTGGSTPSVLTNDTLNSAPVDGAALIIALQTAPPGFSIGSNGSITVPAGAAAGAATLTYQICENTSPTNCATATVSLVIAPTAVNDSVNATGGTASVSGNLADNDNVPTGAVFSAVGTPPAGVTVNSAGTFTYSPPGGITAATSFQYQACLPAPNGGVCATATAAIVVNAVPLVAVDDTFTTPIPAGAGGLTPSVLANDSFNNGAVPAAQVTLSLVGAPSGFVINPNGTVQVPASAAAGPLALTYRFCENALPANCASATANLVVSPDAVDDTISTPGGGRGVTGTVAANDNIAAGATFTLVTAATRGTAVVNLDGTFSYTPTNANTGPDTFTYRVCLPAPNTGVCDTATVTVNVLGNLLTAADDLFTAPLAGGTTTAVSLLANDTLNGAPVAPGAVSLALNGAPTGITANTAGELVIAAATDAGAVAFSYQLCEVATPGNCATANVQLVVAPVAVDDAVTATAGVPLSGSVAGNDNVPGTAQFSLLAVAAHGTVTVNADGSFAYTAQAAYTGADSFRYQVCLPAPNTGVCTSATVAVSVGPGVIVAGDDDFSTAPLTGAGGLTASVLGNDTFNGVAVVPAQAALALTGTPPAGYTLEPNGQLRVPAGAPAGPVALTYQLCQAGTSNCTTANIRVVIAPEARDDAFTTQVARVVSGNVAVNDSIAVGTTYALTSAMPPGLQFNPDGGFTYTPPAQYTGTTTFTYAACLAAPLDTVCDSATVNLTVNAGTLVANDDDFRAALLNPATGGTTNSVLANDTINGAIPPAPAEVILTLVGAPAGYVLNPNGTVSVPGGATAGAVNFSYQLCEAALPTNCATGSVQLLLAPVAVNDNFSTPVGVPLTGTVAGNDNAPPGATFSLSGAAPAGLVFDGSGGFTYTPPGGSQGPVTFAYQVCLPAPNGAVCSGATATLNVNAGTLVAADDDFRGTPIDPALGGSTASVLGNDSLNSVVPPAAADVVLSLLGAPTGYTLAADGTLAIDAGVLAGTVSLTYQLCEAALASNCDTAQIQLRVTPLAVPDVFSTPAGQLLAGSIGSNDNAPVGAIYSVSGATPPGLLLGPDGRFQYTPPTGFTGPVAFTYTVCLPAPDSALCSTANATINVNAGTLVALDDDFSATPLAPGGSSTASVLANDALAGVTPPAPASVLLSLVGAPAGYVLDANGLLQVPASAMGGAAVLRYQLCEAAAPDNCASANVRVVITPSASNDAFSIAAGQVLSDSVGSNDNVPTGSLFAVVGSVPPGLAFTSSGSFTYTPPLGTTGPVTFDYQVCLPAPNTALCATASAAIALTVGTLTAAADDFSATPINPLVGGSTASVLLNDALNGTTPPAATDVRLTLSGAPAGVTLQADGTVSVAAGTAAGARILGYELCEAAAPGNCATSTLRLVVAPAALDDALSTQVNVVLTSSVASNDNAGTGATYTVVGVPLDGLVLGSNGSLTYTPPAGFTGTEVFTYQVCLPGPDTGVCATATATLNINSGTLAAQDDTFTALLAPGAPTLSVLGNDTLNGNPPLPAEVLLTLVGAPTGFSIAADGSISVAAGTVAGATTLTYQLCEAAATSNCDTAQVSVVVTPQPVDDVFAVQAGQTVTGTVASNDNLPVGALYSPSGALPPGVTLGTDGSVSYTPPAGTSSPVSFDYQACLPAPNAAVCGIATARLNINNGTLVASDDSLGAIAPGGSTASVLANDLLNGARPLPASVAVSLVGAPAGFSVAAVGSVLVPVGAAAGATTLVYQLCETAAANNCATASIALVVRPTPVDDAFTVQAGQANTGNVAANDGLPANATWRVAAPPQGLAFNSNGSFTYTPPAGTVGVVTFSYEACLPAPDAAICATATASLTLDINTVVANDDAFTAPLGGGALTPSVLANDTLGTATPPAAAAVQLLLVGAPAGYAINSDGTVRIPVGAVAGATTLTYQLCEAASPTNCDTASIALLVTPAPQNDAFAVQAGGSIANASVAGNDAMPANASWAVQGTPPPGLVFAADGSFSYTPPPGTTGAVTFTYQTCLPAPNAGVCGTATATLNVNLGTLAAGDDSFTGIAPGSTTPSVLVNDLLNAATPPPSSVVLTLVGAPVGYGIAPDGVISVPAGVVSGPITLTYQICEAAAPTNCDTATVALVVSPAPQDDAYAVQAGGTLGNGNVAANDSLPTGSSWAVQGTAPDGLTFNTDGTFSYTPPPGTPGPVTFTYLACLPAPNSALCTAASVTLNINSGTLVATDDSFVGIAAGTTTSASVLGNDVLNGVTPPLAGDVLLSLVGAPAGFSLTAQGTLSVAAGTAAGSSTLTYQVCEAAAPTNCDTASITVVVSPSPQNDAFAVPAGQRVSGSVAANDNLPGGSSYSVQGTLPAGLAFATDGSFTYTPPTGTPSPVDFTYQACLPVPNAALCATASVSLTIGNGTVLAGNDLFSGVVPGTTSATSVLANDSLNGVSPPAASSVLLTLVGAPAGVAITASGTLSVATGTAAGSTTFTYQLCEAAAPGNCATASITLVVAPSPQNDAFSVQAGQTLSASVAGNDNVPTGATWAVQGSLPAGLSFDLDGSFRYTPPPGTPSPMAFTYLACLPAPNSGVCSTATVTLNINTGTLSAGDDRLSGVLPGATTGTSVLANDSLNGVSPPAAADVLLSLVGAPGGMTLNPDGTVSVGSGAMAGATTLTYQICEVAAPTNCDTASVTVVVTPAPQNDAFAMQAGQTLGSTVAANDNVPGTARFALQDPAPAGLLFNADGSFSYTPPVGYAGPLVFAYQVCLAAPDAAQCGRAIATVNINNGLLVAADDSLVGVAAGSTTGTSVLANDSLNGVSPPAAADVLLSLVGAPAGFALTPDGRISVPGGATAGATVLTYQVCEVVAPGNCDTASVTVVVSPAPQNDAFAVQMGQMLSSSVAGNDNLPTGAQYTVQGPVPAGLSLALNGGFTYTPPPGTPGPVTFTYQACLPAPYAAQCGTAVVTLNINDGTVFAGDDVFIGLLPGGTSSTSVLANDRLAGVSPPPPAAVLLSLVGAPAGFTLAADGTLAVGSGVASGATLLTYQLCDAAAPGNCITASITAVVTPSPQNDSYTTPAGRPINGNVARNDNAPADAQYTLTSGAVPGLVLDASGAFTYTPPTSTPGQLTFGYRVCLAAPYASQCGDATVTLVFSASANVVLAVNDDFSSTPVDPAVGGTIAGSVLDNDSFNTVSPPPVGSVIASLTGSTPGFTLNNQGQIMVAPGVQAGTVQLAYQLCENGVPTNCTTAIATVLVQGPVGALLAVDDSGGPVGPAGRSRLLNVFANDTFNSATLDPAQVSFAPVPTAALSFSADGWVDVAAGLAAGEYRTTYTICLLSQPTVCATGNVVVTVIAGEPGVLAEDDRVEMPQNGVIEIDVLGNDRMDGTPIDPDSVTVTITAPPPYGTATVLPRARIRFAVLANFAGMQRFDYQVCEVANPAMCAAAAVWVTVDENVLTLVDDAITAETSGPLRIDVLGNDSTRSAQLDPATLQVVTPATHGQAQCADGACLYTPAADFAGTDSFRYQVCDVSIPTAQCAQANVAVTVAGQQAVLRLTKVAARRSAQVGDLVRYTVTIDNVGEVAANGATLLDTLPPGFSFVSRGFSVSDADNAARTLGVQPLRIEGIDIAAGERATVVYYLRVGAGVGTGVHTNRITAIDGQNRTIGNVASAEVDITADPLLDESLVVGSVFDDRNGNGVQDDGERGIPGVRVAAVEGLLMETDAFGRYHLLGIPGGQARGRNFILKVDTSTLPAEATFTTPNPLVRRITPGLPARFDFGVRLPDGALHSVPAAAAAPRPARIELGDALFAPGAATLQADRSVVLDKAAQALTARGGGRLLLTAVAGQEALARQRAQAVHRALADRLPVGVAAASRIEVIDASGRALHTLGLDDPPDAPADTDRTRREGR